MRALPAVAAALLAGAPAMAQPPAPAEQTTTRDPLEGFNRAVWGLNQGIDTVILKPAATAYRTVTPRPARRGISRVFANLSEPWSAINALLQGKPKRALNSLGRFVINTTIGVGGLADHATGMGLKPTPEDFGQTLASWGVRSSAYLVLPLLGPSTVRDGVGAGVAQFGDPYRVCLRECGLPNGLPTALTITEVVDTRAQLIDAGADAFLKTAADPYATARSAFFQRRAAQIADRDEDAVTPVSTTGDQGDDAQLDAAIKEIDQRQAEPQQAPPPSATPPSAAPPSATPEPPRLEMVPLNDD